MKPMLGGLVGLFVGTTAGGLVVRLAEVFLREQASTSAYGFVMFTLAFLVAAGGFGVGMLLDDAARRST